MPGNDPAHLGGDTWAADAAMKIMENENWSGMLLTMGGIDKIGHMWGGGLVDNTITTGPDAMVHMPFVAKNADDQVGRIIQKLRDLQRARRHAHRADRRPRRADGHELLRRQRPGRRQHELVLRPVGQRRQRLPDAVARPGAADRDRQRGVLATRARPSRPGCIDQSAAKKTRGGAHGHAHAARRHRDLHPRRRPLRARHGDQDVDQDDAVRVSSGGSCTARSW